MGRLFQVGDKIVYPLHGAGVIDAVEEKEILGKKQRYYIIHMSLGNVQIMIPADRIDDMGLRHIVDPDTMENVFLLFNDDPSASSGSWNQRFRMNMDKMKTGDIFKTTEVIRDLAQINKEKSLGTGEKKLLDNAKQILISELVLVKEIEEEQAIQLLDEAAHC
ncbi:CarD family transcriptional regulator [Kroppenstedtia eburnea]|uniref:CarD family transcriptional regulator n=1 Tax=Kroppenstedtia eburnea TaxID=714067 RepID=UPI00020C8317|nr:CarD family transcriptional regulator [Kroppenstedtia eburnea]EGK13297.1 CarD family transcriptional regulator [Desmospora sp. 8437]